jgi:hypothetical protein
VRSSGARAAVVVPILYSTTAIKPYGKAAVYSTVKYSTWTKRAASQLSHFTHADRVQLAAPTPSRPWGCSAEALTISTSGSGCSGATPGAHR